MDSTEDPHLPSWFSPFRLLLLFMSMSFLVYVDRGDAPSIKRAPMPVRKKPASKSTMMIRRINLTFVAGVISSNGVNGGPSTPTSPGFGIQVRNKSR